MADKGIAAEEVQDSGRDCQEYRNNTETIPIPIVPVFDIVEYREIPKQSTVLDFLEYRKIPEKHRNGFRAAGI